jgi:hypothetical protein
VASKKRRKAAKPREGSLRWYKERWGMALGPASARAAEALAHLCIQNNKLHKKIVLLEEALEEVQDDMYRALHNMGHSLSHVTETMKAMTSVHLIKDQRRWLANDGMVKIEGVLHLRECRRVAEPGSTSCTCGSVPSRRPN